MNHALSDVTVPPVAISILLPVFNGSAFVEEQIASILAQTFHDYELLIYDDGSSDGSIDQLGHFARADPRIRLFGSGVNLGQPSALCYLLAQARGRYIMFSDQDDIWHPRKIEVLLAAIGDAALSYGVSRLIDQDGQDLGKTIFDFVGTPLEGADKIEFLFRNVVSGHALLARREVVTPSIFVCGAEYDWLMAILATFSGGVVYAPHAITHHRQHANNQLNVFGRPPGWTNPLKHPQSKRRHRIMRLNDALSVLRLTTTVADPKRAAFNRLFLALRQQIVLGVTPLVYNTRFELIFAATLDDLNIPASDRQGAYKLISKICRGPLHPKTIRDGLVGLL